MIEEFGFEFESSITQNGVVICHTAGADFDFWRGIQGKAGYPFKNTFGCLRTLVAEKLKSYLAGIIWIEITYLCWIIWNLKCDQYKEPGVTRY